MAQREVYEAVVAHRDGAFITDRPALFSPAAAAQDPANAKGMYAPFAQILMPQEYTGWALETRAHVSASTRTMSFADGEIVCNERVIATASAVFRNPRPATVRR